MKFAAIVLITLIVLAFLITLYACCSVAGWDDEINGRK